MEETLLKQVESFKCQNNLDDTLIAEMLCRIQLHYLKNKVVIETPVEELDEADFELFSRLKNKVPIKTPVEELDEADFELFSR